MTVSNTANISSLSQAVADRIAAGEVVERPAAVVKELIENSLDAGADKISVIIQDAGRTLIRIVDNGSGMSEENLKRSISRHATSKIQRFEDLETLSTFGFRGEALPSIAAVSRLEILSRTVDSEVGTLLKVSGGQVDRCEPTTAPGGTSISVSHLFFNVPARRKFLRSDPTEFKWIATIFKQFALAFPDVSWELFRGTQRLYELPACSPRERLAALFGDDIAEDLVEINHQHSWAMVTGFISPPSLTQRNKDSQFLFLNTRPIFHPGLNQAIYTSCEPYFVSGGHPLYVVYLNAPPDHFDINVHPAKKQVKFADESVPRNAVWKAVRNAITGARKPEEYTTQPESSSSESEVFTGTSKSFRQVDVKSPDHLKPFTAISRHYNSPPQPVMPFPVNQGENAANVQQPTNIEPALAELKAQEDLLWSGDAANESIDSPEIWQVFNTFIIAPLKTGLAFIDQHVAHERILYEKALAAMENVPWTSQQLLFPVTFSVSPEDAAIIEETLPLFRAMGFTIEPFGPREFRIEAVPVGIRISDEKEMVLGILWEVKEERTTQADPRKQLAAGFSCKAAIKAGQPLEVQEMQRLIEELFQTEDPEFCPHGRPIYHVLGRREVEKWFKR